MLILCISNDDLFICQCACLRCIIFPSLQDSYMYAIAEIDVKNIFFTRSPKILQFDRIKNYLYSMSRFYQTCWKMFLAFCLIGFLTHFKLLFFVLDFVFHRFWCPSIFEKKWDTPLCSCYFNMHTRACTTHLDMCLLFILKLAWTQGRVPLNDTYILFKWWCVYGNRNKWYTDWYTRLWVQEYWDYTYLFRFPLPIGSH